MQGACPPGQSWSTVWVRSSDSKSDLTRGSSVTPGGFGLDRDHETVEARVDRDLLDHGGERGTVEVDPDLQRQARMSGRPTGSG